MTEPTDQNQQPDNSTPPATPAPFDPANLPPEVQRYIDQQRTQASQTAYKNALKDAENDPKILEKVSAKLAEDARMSAEEKVQRERDALEAEKQSLQVERNSITATSALVAEGIDRDVAAAIVPFVTTADPNATAENVKSFLTAFNGAVEAKVEAVKTELLANGGAPRVGGGGKGSEAAYREDYKKALEAGETAKAITIQRKALAEGFSI